MARDRRSGLLLPVAAGLLLLCTGCAAGPAPAPTASAAAAPTFPAVPGEVLDASASDVQWHRVVRVEDAGAAYEEARQLLVDGGYTITKDREGTGGGDGQACTTRLCVSFGATDIPGKGATLVYDWFRPTGIVD